MIQFPKWLIIIATVIGAVCGALLSQPEILTPTIIMILKIVATICAAILGSRIIKLSKNP